MAEVGTVQSLDRSFDILELLSTEQHGFNLTEISKRLDLHKSTVYRLLSSLKRRGYVEQNGSRGFYRLGMGFLDLCSLFLNNLELKTEAEPFLRRLSQLTTQTVYLAILQESEVVYIDKMEQHASLRKYSIIGQRRPLHCTSLGKALLSGMSDQEVLAFFPNSSLPALTPKTITSRADLIQDLHACRKRGWSYDDQEYALGEHCIGAPIYDYRDIVIAAVSTSWLMASFCPANLEEIAGHVKEAAQDISKRMGCRDPQSCLRKTVRFNTPDKL